VIGQDVQLHLKVMSPVDNEDLRIQVDLPAALREGTTTNGFAVQRRSSLRPSDRGSVNRLTATVDAKAGRMLTYDIGVVAVTPGPTTVRVTAISPRGAAFGSAEAHAPVVVGTTTKDAKLGVTSGDDAAETTPAGTTLIDR
jgi:hypothetical protein